MAKYHAELQKSVKSLFEGEGWYITENKKGRHSRNYNSGICGIADLQAVRPRHNVIWIEIKTSNDTQKPDQKEFQKTVEFLGHKYYVVYSIGDAEQILRLNNGQQT